jgi:hypothetical protein
MFATGHLIKKKLNEKTPLLTNHGAVKVAKTVTPPKKKGFRRVIRLIIMRHDHEIGLEKLLALKPKVDEFARFLKLILIALCMSLAVGLVIAFPTMQIDDDGYLRM